MRLTAKKYNRRTPKACTRCHGTGFVRAKHDTDTIMRPRNFGSHIGYQAACPCTVRGLRNLDPETLRAPERQALSLYKDGNAIAAIARKQRCSAEQAITRIVFAEQVLTGQRGPAALVKLLSEIG